MKEGTYNAIGAWEKDAETEQAEQWPTDHPEDTESSLEVKYTTRGQVSDNVHPADCYCKTNPDRMIVPGLVLSGLFRDDSRLDVHYSAYYMIDSSSNLLLSH